MPKGRVFATLVLSNMADEDVRALERTWRESGSTEDEAAYLAARVRSGLLPQENVELAASLGDRAARRALGQELAEGEPPSPFGPWPGDVSISALLEVAVRLLEGADPALASTAAPCLSSALACLVRGSKEDATSARLASHGIREVGQSRPRVSAVLYLAMSAARHSADLVEGIPIGRTWEGWVQAVATRASGVVPEATVRDTLAVGACRRLLGRAPNAWLQECGSPGWPTRPPLESTLDSLQSTLCWVHEHLSGFRQLREQGNPLAEVELGHLVSQVRDARSEAERLSEILRLWDTKNVDPGP